MSGALSIITDAAAPYAYLGGNARMIGVIVPDVTIEEDHVDEMTVTDHPVEIGTAITDHAFLQPSRLDMHVGTSNSTGQAVGYVQQVYAEFLALQAQRQPFPVSTGKRQYQNMLISSLMVTTDKDRENALDLTVSMRAVILTSTSTTSGSGGGSSVNTAPSGGDSSIPQSTDPSVSTGQVSLAPLSNFATIPGSSAGADAPLSNLPLIPGSQPII